MDSSTAGREETGATRNHENEYEYEYQYEYEDIMQ
jgi:hypothetical protein